MVGRGRRRKEKVGRGKSRAEGGKKGGQKGESVCAREGGRCAGTSMSVTSTVSL